jgi:hypothetical protein
MHSRPFSVNFVFRYKKRGSFIAVCRDATNSGRLEFHGERETQLASSLRKREKERGKCWGLLTWQIISQIDLRMSSLNPESILDQLLSGLQLIECRNLDDAA